MNKDNKEPRVGGITFDAWYTSITIEGDMKHNMRRTWDAALASQTQAAPSPQAAGDELDRVYAAPVTAQQADGLAGRTVSVDVSTSENDAGNRIFAELTGETGSDGATLLAIESSRNFPAPAIPERAEDARDAEQLGKAVTLLKRLKRDLMSARRFQPDTLATYRFACTSAESDIEEFIAEYRAAMSAAASTNQGESP